MKKFRFTETYRVQAENGRTYQSGQVYELNPGQADHFGRKGIIEPVAGKHASDQSDNQTGEKQLIELTRDELNAVATGLGLDAVSFKNKTEVIAAIELARVGNIANEGQQEKALADLSRDELLAIAVEMKIDPEKVDGDEALIAAIAEAREKAA